jgi:hypothetical protein
MRPEPPTIITGGRPNVTRAGAHRQEIHILHGRAGGLQTIQNRAATSFHRAGKITLVLLIGCLLEVWSTSEVKMTALNVAVQENLPNAFAFVTRSVEALLLREPNRRVRRSNSKDSWGVHWGRTVSCGELVWRLRWSASRSASN